MDLSRRAFLGTVPAAAVANRGGGLLDLASHSPQVADPLGVRADFPVAEAETYLNGAYITPSPTPVVEAAGRFLAAKARDPVSLGEMLSQVDRVREGFARLIGAKAREVGTLYATSDGENVVTRALELGLGHNVVVDDLHYETTYLLYEELARTRGVELRIAESVEGAAPAERYEPLVDNNTRLVSVSWVSHQNGYRHDLKALATVAHDRGAYLYVDAIQGVGALELDVVEAGVDFLTAGTYKWLLGGFGVAPFF
ncbi:MAG: aminotransferase class V-fold PLP-dependent enzyme, partial [Gemmatimonadota bacterium]|nr:aminotransferase class V-fold PLP-dependent enzyme [Gemmatimonadota bacterium]